MHVSHITDCGGLRIKEHYYVKNSVFIFGAGLAVRGHGKGIL